MRKLYYVACLFILSMFLCNCSNESNNNAVNAMNQEVINEIVDSLLKVSEFDRFVIEKGIKQAALLWNTTDGDIAQFKQICYTYFAKDKESKKKLFEVLSHNFEILFGYFNRITIELMKPLHLSEREILPIDEIFGSYNVSAHLLDDFFKNKIAFITIINFPSYNLNEKNEYGKKWTREEWAYACLGDIFISRIPSNLLQKFNEAVTKADIYISEYNIIMGNIQSENKELLFPKEMKLISHWGLRDELKSNYSDKEKGFLKQKTIYEIMKRIITQEIPVEVINNNNLIWNPFENKVYDNNKSISFKFEPNTRYTHMLNIFKAIQQLDSYNPQYPTFIQRKFDLDMGIQQEEVEQLFKYFVSSDIMKSIGNLISKRLGRKLEPFDIWYDGFKPRSSLSEKTITEKTQKMFSDVPSFQQYIPIILEKLGFEKKTAKDIASKIIVDASRGAGHAWGSEMRGDFARLRTRFTSNGMDYKGYNIAIHELGHNVEQTISLYNIDYYMLRGVPNTAFTEALAFIFQKRDLELLGLKENNPEKDYLSTLDITWSTYEIMGVSLVDMRVWKWLYSNPNATAEELKQQVLIIAKDVWNKYYAPVFGKKDEPILAIYSHMIDAPLYLSAYPLGHIIEFQIEQHIKDKNFAKEVMRMYSLGRLTPNKWMQEATGHNLSVEPMLNAAKEALKHIN